MKKKVLKTISAVLAGTLMSTSAHAANISIQNAPDFQIYNNPSDDGSLSILQTNPHSSKSVRVILSKNDAKSVSVNSEQLAKNALIGIESNGENAKEAALVFVGSAAQAFVSGPAAFYATTAMVGASAASGLIIGFAVALQGSGWVFNYVDSTYNKELYNELKENGDLAKVQEGITALLNNEEKQITFKRVEAYNALSNIMVGLNKALKEGQK